VILAYASFFLIPPIIVIVFPFFLFECSFFVSDFTAKDIRQPFPHPFLSSLSPLVPMRCRIVKFFFSFESPSFHPPPTPPLFLLLASCVPLVNRDALSLSWNFSLGSIALLVAFACFPLVRISRCRPLPSRLRAPNQQHRLCADPI